MKLSEVNPSENIKVLTYGEAGAGKTVFACSFPGPIYVADFDGKVSSAAAYYKHIGQTERLEEIDFDEYNKGAQGVAFGEWGRKLAEFEREAKEGTLRYKTIVIDSLTFFADRAMEKVMADNPGIKSPVKGIPGLQHYGVFNPFIKWQLGRVLSLPCNVVVTSHIKVDKDDLTGQIIKGPNLTGKLQAFIPVLFPEVYRQYAERKGETTRYLLQTKPDLYFSTIRSQIPTLGQVTEAKYESLIGNGA